MIKVSDVISEILHSDEVALEAALENVLNLSAYAEKIHSKVEKATLKTVKKGTIVVALSRLTKHLEKSTSRIPHISLVNLSVKSSLSVITYKKTFDLQRKISVMNPFLLSINDLFSVTEGQDETTVICSDSSKEEILKQVGAKPKAEENGLVAIVVKFSQKDAITPNVIHTLLSSLALKRINIVEIVSTYTEISFILKKEDLETAFKTLNRYFGNK